MVIWVKKILNELMVEINSKGLVRAIDKSITSETSPEHPLKPIKVMGWVPLMTRTLLSYVSSQIIMLFPLNVL